MSEIVYNETDKPFEFDDGKTKSLTLPGEGVCTSSYPEMAIKLCDHNVLFFHEKSGEEFWVTNDNCSS